MMRALVLSAAAAAALASGGVQAQPRDAQPPPGNYLQTCRNVSTQGYGRDASMTAECRDRDGRWRRTSLLFHGCDRVENHDGALSCMRARGPDGRSQDVYPPPGPGPRPGDSYPPPGPGPRPGDAYPPPGPMPGPPAGPAIGPLPGPGYGGRASITLFSAPDFGGRPFFADREITNLPRDYNDRAMSLRIDGRRAWMICADSDFRGRCQVFDHDVRDLRQVGLGGKISSMRPVR